MSLPGEVSQADRADAKQEPAVVTTNCEKSAEAIVAEKKREGPNNRKSE